VTIKTDTVEWDMNLLKLDMLLMSVCCGCEMLL